MKTNKRKRKNINNPKIKNIHLVYFSPSGSTEKIVRTIASAIEGIPVVPHNLLPYNSRKEIINFQKDDLVIFGMISAGMLFTKAEEIFNCLKGNETPFIGVISYGNAYYGVALTEMNERAEKSGFKVTALGAFISRHSMSPALAEGRPDSHDKEIMLDFGKRAYEKVLSGNLKLTNKPVTNWPKFDKYNFIVEFREKNKEPYCFPEDCRDKEISDECVKCGTCVRNCPTNAINIETKSFDLKKCIGCWACINRCPKHAIKSSSEKVIEMMKDFTETFQTIRLEPDIYL